MKKIILLLFVVLSNGILFNTEATKRKLIDQGSVSNKRVRLSEELPNNLYNYFDDFQLLKSLVNENKSEEIAQLCIDDRALHKAIMDDDLESVKWILKYTKGYKVEDDSGFIVPYIDSAFQINGSLISTPLMEAIDVNSKEILITLIKKGADVNLEIEPEPDAVVSALKYAIERANLDIIKLLVEQGAMVNELSDENFEPTYQPLSYALELQEGNGENPKIIKYLISQGAYINKKDPRTNSYPFDIALNGKLYQCLRILIKNGVSKYSRENKDILKLLKDFESKKVEDYKEYFENLSSEKLRTIWIYILENRLLKVLNNYNLSSLSILSFKENRLAEFLYKVYTKFSSKNQIDTDLTKKIISCDFPEWKTIKKLNLKKLAQDIRLKATLSNIRDVNNRFIPIELVSEVVSYAV